MVRLPVFFPGSVATSRARQSYWVSVAKHFNTKLISTQIILLTPGGHDESQQQLLAGLVETTSTTQAAGSSVIFLENSSILSQGKYLTISHFADRVK